jgi:endogenous inhibitor of DNA gyrase (YacG/DUF329 family)
MYGLSDMENKIENLAIKKTCVICGNVLVKPKFRYCSPLCYRIGINRISYEIKKKHRLRNQDE